MTTLGFTALDFEVFSVEGFDERMQQIYAHVRPKLLRLGDELAPEIAQTAFGILPSRRPARAPNRESTARDMGRLWPLAKRLQALRLSRALHFRGGNPCSRRG